MLTHNERHAAPERWRRAHKRLLGARLCCRPTRRCCTGARGSQSAERMRARARVRARRAMCASGAAEDTRCARESVQSASWLEHGRVGHRCRKSFFAKEFFNFYSRAIRLHATHAAPDARRKDSTHSTLEPRTDEHHQRDRMHAARCTPHTTHCTPHASRTG